MTTKKPRRRNRPGAGRPTEEDDPVFGVRITLTAKQIEAAKATGSISGYVRKLIREDLSNPAPETRIQRLRDQTVTKPCEVRDTGAT